MKHPFPKSGYDPISGEWNDSLRGEFLWSNVNVSEAVPDVMTPSTWSLWWIFHYETNPLEFPGDGIFCGNICGRPYLNLSLLASVYHAVGQDPRKEMRGDMIGSAPEDLDIPSIPFSAFLVYRTVLPGMLKMRRRANRDPKRFPEFLETARLWQQTTRSAIQACQSSEALLELWLGKIRPMILHGCQMLRSAAMALGAPATQLRLDLAALTGEADANALFSNLSGESGDLESLGLLVGLAKLRKGELNPTQYMERYGHRGPHEMELYAPGAEDDPNWLEKLLANFNQSDVDVDALLAKQRAESTAAWQRFEARYPNRIKSTRRRLDIIALLARNREAVRSEVTRMTRLLRQYLLQAGKVCELGNDIFFLSLDEMAALLEGDLSAVSRIPARREAYQRYSALPPYPTIILGKFDPFAWAADPQRRSDYYDSRKVQSSAATKKISGFAGAAGVVEGLVRRLDKPEESNQLEQGEILVTVTTNIGWTPIFPRLAAIVTDVGAPLSHAAIVARELGIPAVVGCGNATMLLKTGDRVRVDGGRGSVEILSR